MRITEKILRAYVRSLLLEQALEEPEEGGAESDGLDNDSDGETDEEGETAEEKGEEEEEAVPGN